MMTVGHQVNILLTIEFSSQLEDASLQKAVVEYEAIWHQLRFTISKVFEHLTQLRFSTASITATVHEGISRSHPLMLRASYPKTIKAAMLVHELGHRLLVDNDIVAERGDDFHRDSHRLLNLFLYDAYVELFGAESANEIITWESGLQTSYRETWAWALALEKAERARRLSNIRQDKQNWLACLEGRA